MVVQKKGGGEGRRVAWQAPTTCLQGVRTCRPCDGPAGPRPYPLLELLLLLLLLLFPSAAGAGRMA